MAFIDELKAGGQRKEIRGVVFNLGAESPLDFSSLGDLTGISLILSIRADSKSESNYGELSFASEASTAVLTAAQSLAFPVSAIKSFIVLDAVEDSSSDIYRVGTGEAIMSPHGSSLPVNVTPVEFVDMKAELEELADDAAVSATAAEDSRLNSGYSANASANSENNAGVSATQASSSATEAEQSKLDAIAAIFLENSTYRADRFRLDSTVSKRALQSTVDGQMVSSMEIEDILHFGDGYAEFRASEARNLTLTLQMSTALTAKNIKLIVTVYDSTNTVVGMTGVDDELAPDDLSEFEVTIANVLTTSSILTDTKGRVEVRRKTPTTNDHSGDIQVKQAVINYV